ncbi:MAG: ATP synthase F1 subunit delta [Ruminococcaceae bacterium]|nr:ATP synthase F1 subunit delta [Oscillospiraceae bacterium]
MNDAAKEYGGALFDLAREDGLDGELLGEIRVIRDLFSENPGYVRLLSSPNIPKEERLHCLDDLLSGRAHPYILNFLKMLTERNHARSVLGCFNEYERLYYETHGIIRAKAESAVELTDSQKERLRERMEAMTGKKIELECTVNQTLIAGVRLTVNNRLYEGSVKAKLKAIGESLSSVTM